MNQVLIKECTEALDLVLSKHAAPDDEVADLRKDLSGLMHDARCGRITAPIKDVPWSYAMNNGQFQFKYPDLASAYAKFALAITTAE